MKTVVYLFVSIYILVICTSCDRIALEDRVITQVTTDQPIDTLAFQNIERQEHTVVLLEEFTGHKCINCPDAAIIANDIAKANNGRVQVIGIHPNIGFAQANTSGDMYTTNFIIEELTESNNYFQFYGGGTVLPAGVVNRTTQVVNAANWEGQVNNALVKEAVFSIKIIYNYDENTKNLTVANQVEVLKDVSNSYNIISYLIEDSIIDWQLTFQGPIENYVHNHVLRDVFGHTTNGNFWGASIIENSAKTGDILYNQSSLTIRENFNIKNLSVVSFVYDFTSTNREILQTRYVKLIL